MIASPPVFRRLFRILLAGILCAPRIITAGPPAVPELPPLPPSPIQQFRDWLSMNEAERDRAVSEWPAEKQKILLQKLRAYQALPPEERERRLKMLELRWYLRPMMGTKPEERTPMLALVPPSLRRLVQERLRHWDSLDAGARQDILQNDQARELVTRFYLQLQQGRSTEQLLSSLNPAKRAELESALAVWNALSASARSRTAEQLTSFFQLSRNEQERAFQELPETEREEVQKTLDAFARLSPEQRRLCVESFEKFTLMPPPERASFLRNAARWQAMTPEDRAAWKQLVTKLPPFPPSPVPEPPRPHASGPSKRMAGAERAQ